MTIQDISGVRQYLLGLQEKITSSIAALDGQAFVADHWQKAAGESLQGNGITTILEQGRLFERAGCGFSHVRGPKLPPSATQRRPNWPVRRLKPWGCRWCFIRAILMYPRCT